MDHEAAPNTPSKRILKAMGGIRPAAKKLGKKPTTVQYWADTGIPQKHQQLVLDTCQREGVKIDGRDVSPADFFEVPSQDAGAAPQQDAAA